MILAIDPGPTESAFVLYDGTKRHLRVFKKITNDEALVALREQHDFMRDMLGCPLPQLVVEMIASYGMPVGREVFDTCVWIGRFIQAWPGEHVTITRGAIKSHLCNSVKAKDGNVRQALIDRFGGSAAIGKKKTPGPLYGVSGDVWAALAVAVTYAERTVAA